MNVTSEWYMAQQKALGKPVSGSGSVNGSGAAWGCVVTLMPVNGSVQHESCVWRKSEAGGCLDLYKGLYKIYIATSKVELYHVYKCVHINKCWFI